MSERTREALLERWRSGDLQVRAGVIEPAARQGPIPVSWAQERLWFVEQFHPGTPVSNLVFCAEADGRLDPDVLARAFDDVVVRHQALRTVVRLEGREPHQIVLPEAAARLDVQECAERDEALARVDEMTHQPFDLATGPLLRCALLRLPDDDLLALVAHHIVGDGWSLGVLLRELDRRYRGEALAGPALQFADVAVWQRDARRADVWRSELDYWTGHLADAPPLEVPTDHPRPAVFDPSGDWREVVLSRSLSDGLHELARTHGVSTFMVLHATFAMLLAKVSGNPDVTVGTAVADRARPETHDMVGNLTNLVALRLQLDDDPSLAEVLDRARRIGMAAFARAQVPFERVVEELAPARDPSRNAVFQALLVLQPPTPDLEVGGVPLRFVERAVRAVQADLELHLWDLDRIRGRLAFSRALFDGATVDDLVARYETVLRALVTAPDQQLFALDLVTLAEAEQQVTWGTGPALAPTGPLLPDAIAAHADTRPDIVAVRAEDEALTYRDLRDRVDALAARLVARGVVPEDRVGVCLERGVDMVVAPLGVMRAGAAYVPLDPSYPQDRLRACVADAGIRCVVTTPDLPALAEPAEVDGAAPETPVDLPALHPDQLAYVIHTSGSTGHPKGVAITHRALRSLVDGLAATVGLSAADVCTSIASLSFDASVAEMYPVLALGGTLVVVSRDDAADGNRLADLASAHGVTHLQATATTWRLLRAAGRLADLPCRRGLVGGEPTPPDLADDLARRLPEIWSIYGPTEATVWATTAPLVVGDGVSLGAPLPNAGVHVLDEHLQPVPVGTSGELCIVGDGLARGYFGSPSATALAFVPDPFATEPGHRMYRTGDVVRYRPGGRLEFLARRDNQIKLRGHRIELGDVEAALTRLDGVAAAVAVVHAPTPEAAMLVAYVQPTVHDDGIDIRIVRWRDELRRLVPPYMVPGRFVPVEEFPTTATGKIDRRRLPDPVPVAPAVRAKPSNALEQEVVDRIAAALDLDEVGLDDDFFDLGGHSVLAAHIMTDLADSHGLQLGVQELFRVPTARNIAGYMARELEARRQLEDPAARLRSVVARLDDATVDALLATLSAERG